MCMKAMAQLWAKRAVPVGLTLLALLFIASTSGSPPVLAAAGNHTHTLTSGPVSADEGSTLTFKVNVSPSFYYPYPCFS